MFDHVRNAARAALATYRAQPFAVRLGALVVLAVAVYYAIREARRG